MTNDAKLPPLTSPRATDRYVFIGRIHPERYGWHVEPDFEGDFEFGGEHLHLALSVQRAQLVVAVVGKYGGGLLDLKNAVVDFAQCIVDALGFVAAAALDLEILSCLDPVGGFRVFNTGFDGLRDQDGDLVHDEALTFRTLALTGAQDFGVRAGLADLRQAIRAPGDTLFYCYRAIESVRQQYLPPDADADDRQARKTSWEAMRGMAGIEEAETRWLEPKATARRHGSLTEVTEQDRRRALLLARKIVIEHARSKGSGPQSG